MLTFQPHEDLRRPNWALASCNAVAALVGAIIPRHDPGHLGGMRLAQQLAHQLPEELDKLRPPDRDAIAALVRATLANGDVGASFILSVISLRNDRWHVYNCGTNIILGAFAAGLRELLPPNSVASANPGAEHNPVDLRSIATVTAGPTCSPDQISQASISVTQTSSIMIFAAPSLADKAVQLGAPLPANFPYPPSTNSAWLLATTKAPGHFRDDDLASPS